MDTKPTDSDRSRREVLTAQGRLNALEMPEISKGYLIEYLGELGWITAQGTGISYQEIQSWAQLTKKQLSGWEAIMIKRLSDTFASQYNKKDTDEMPPYQSRPETAKEASIRLKAQMRRNG